MSTSTKRISAIAAAAALILVVGWYLALFSPEHKKLSAAHKAHAAAEQQISSLNSQVLQLQALEKQIPADTKRYASLSAAVPDRPQLDAVLTQLHQIATASGVLLSSVGPSAPTSTSSGGGSQSSSSGSQSTAGGPPVITMSLSATGTYGQLMRFLSELASIPRVFVVDHLGLAGSGNQMSASINGRIFYAGQPTP